MFVLSILSDQRFAAAAAEEKTVNQSQAQAQTQRRRSISLSNPARLPGTARPQEIAAMLNEDRPVGYFVMQAEVWRFCSRFPLDAPRITFAMSIRNDGATASEVEHDRPRGSYVSASLSRASG
jgi:hypothetical protein